MVGGVQSTRGNVGDVAVYVRATTPDMGSSDVADEHENTTIQVASTRSDCTDLFSRYVASVQHETWIKCVLFQLTEGSGTFNAAHPGTFNPTAVVASPTRRNLQQAPCVPQWTNPHSISALWSHKLKLFYVSHLLKQSVKPY